MTFTAAPIHTPAKALAMCCRWQGIHPKVVSERLGHSDIAITLNTYSHAILALQADAATTKVASLVFDS